jgi:hypothetical protein
VLLGVGEHLVNRDVAPQLRAEGGDAGVRDAARHDHLGSGQVTAADECEPVHRDVVAHPDAGVTAGRIAGRSGVWIQADGSGPDRKIGAI